MPDIITRALFESKGIPTRDIVAAIWGRKLSGGYEPAELTGTLPLTFRSNGTALLDYRIYGNTVETQGVGVRTENLFDPNAKNVDNGYNDHSVIGYPDGKISNLNWAYVTEYIPVDSNTNYVMFMNLYRSAYYDSAKGLVFYDENKDFISAIRGCTALSEVTYENPKNGILSFTTPKNCKYIRTNVDKLATMLMLVAASTPPPTYIPYGYKLPMVSRSGTHRTDTPIYIGDTQLMKDEYVSYESGKIYRLIDRVLTPTDPPVPLPELPTFSDIDTVLDYEETPAPEEAWVKYKKGD